MLKQLTDFLPSVLLPVLKVLLCALAGYLGLKARALYTRYINSREKEAVARIVVQATEQLCLDLHGKDKLNAALDRMSTLLAARGIRVSAEEATLLIEAAVAEFNRAFDRTPVESAA